MCLIFFQIGHCTTPRAHNRRNWHSIYVLASKCASYIGCYASHGYSINTIYVIGVIITKLKQGNGAVSSDLSQGCKECECAFECLAF